VLAGGSLPSPEHFGRLAMQTIVPEALTDNVEAYVAHAARWHLGAAVRGLPGVHNKQVLIGG